jgi:hypothetical protein
MSSQLPRSARAAVTQHVAIPGRSTQSDWSAIVIAVCGEASYGRLGGAGSSVTSSACRDPLHALLVPTKEGADLGPCRQVVPKLHADHLIDKHESSTIGDPLVPKVVNIVVPKQRAENNVPDPRPGHEVHRVIRLCLRGARCADRTHTSAGASCAGVRGAMDPHPAARVPGPRPHPWRTAPARHAEWACRPLQRAPAFQARQQLRPTTDAAPPPITDLAAARVRRRTILHGLISEYSQAA